MVTMKRFSLHGFSVAALFAVTAFASETVVKNSTPFSFPLTVGVVTGKHAFIGQTSFTAAYRMSVGRFLELNWTLPDNQKHGVISLFSLNGILIRSFPISKPSGSIRYNVAGGSIAKGIYFARLSSGTIKKDHKIVIY